MKETLSLLMMLLALVGLGMSLYESVKSVPMTRNWYRTFLSVCGVTILISLFNYNWFGVIIWSIVFGLAIVRIKKYGITLF